MFLPVHLENILPNFTTKRKKCFIYKKKLHLAINNLFGNVSAM